MKGKLKILKKPLRNRVVVLLFVVIGFFLYVNTLGNEMFWDDFDSIINNQYVHDLRNFPKYFSENLIAGAGLGSNYWRPVLLTTFSIQWQFWKDWAPGYHFVNMSLHVVNAILLFFLLSRFFKNSWLAILTALVFLVHPLQTEAVTYVAGLGDPLSVLFIFSGLLFYVKFKISEKDGYESIQYYLVILMYMLALMTKETTIIMPGLIFLIDFFYGNAQELSAWKRLKDSFKRLIPFICIAFLYVFLRATVLNFGNTFNLYGEENTFTQNFHYRLFTFFRTLTIYFKLLFLPFNLHMERTVEIASSVGSLSVILGAFMFLSLLALAFTQFKKHPILTFGIFWFFISLFPMSNLFVPINGLIYEHWMYVALIGVFIIVVWLGQLVAKKFKGVVMKKVLIIVFVMFLLFLSFLTIRRNRDWKDPVTFYNNTLEYSPDSYRIVNNLGMAYADLGEYEKAERAYRKVISLDPSNPVAYHNLGNNYKEVGEIDLAIENYNKAISQDSTFLPSYVALSELYLENDDYQTSQKVLESSIGKTAKDFGVLILLSERAYNNSDFESCLSYLEKALEIEPNNISVQETIWGIKQMMEEK